MESWWVYLSKFYIGAEHKSNLDTCIVNKEHNFAECLIFNCLKSFVKMIQKIQNIFPDVIVECKPT